MKLTLLEREILEWIAAHAFDDALREQCSQARVKSREYTGHGFFTDLHVPDGIPALNHPIRWRVDPYPYISSPALEIGGGCVLHQTGGYLKGGYLYCLEIFAYGSDFPENLTEFSLHVPKRAEIKW